jgi:hypothetical protein
MRKRTSLFLGAVLTLCLLLGGSAAMGEAETPAAPADVFFTANITPEGLRAAYDALGWSPTGKLAVKVTTGEPPNSNYLRQENQRGHHGRHG